MNNLAKHVLEKHLATALHEVGEIHPWWDEEVNCYVFSNPLYPDIEAGEATPVATKLVYIEYLREFLKHRLNGNLAEIIEKSTKGKAGKCQDSEEKNPQ